MSRFLITRGLWLIVLEFTLVRLGATFSLDYRFLGMMQVIWVIGVSMIVLAGLIHLPLRVIAGFGVVMIALHNLLDSFHVQGWQGPGQCGAELWREAFYDPAPGLRAVSYCWLAQPGGVCALPADSVDRRDGCRLRVWRDISMGRRAETEAVVDA